MKKGAKIFWLVVINSITLIRFVGAFLLPVIYIKKGPATSALCTICLFLTDMIDGTLARTLKLSTFFGSALDASCDKILNATAFILLGFEYQIMFMPLILEIAILYTIYSTYRYGGNIQSSKMGKIKTIILDLFVILSFILMGLPNLNLNYQFIIYLINKTDGFIQIFALIITFACILALHDYMKKNNDARKNPKSETIKSEKKTLKTIKELIDCALDTEYYQIHKNESIVAQFYK